MLPTLVFQHGDGVDIAAYFARVGRLLRPGGLFFLRVNSASTEVWHRHAIVEGDPLGGFTVRYEDGPSRTSWCTSHRERSCSRGPGRTSRPWPSREKT